jgi:hypothetical protein
MFKFHLKIGLNMHFTKAKSFETNNITIEYCDHKWIIMNIRGIDIMINIIRMMKLQR